MASAKQDPVQAIANSPLREVIVKGFAELYRVKPDFPVEFLGQWLKDYSQSQSRIKHLEATKVQKEEQVVEMERNLLEKAKKTHEIHSQKEEEKNKSEAAFIDTVTKTDYLQDLLNQYLPDAIEKFCDQRGVSLSGCYIGELKFRHKKLQEHSFEPGAELDTQSPKVIEYVGGSKSHRFMIGQILPNQAGRSYEVFKEEEPPVQQEEGKPAKIKKKYLYVPLVQKDQKMHFFRFPKLGSFACFPLKVKGALFTESFDKGIGDYKAFVKNKQQVEKQYSQKLNEARNSYEEAKRKFQDHELNEEDPNSQADHTNLHQQMNKTEQILREIQENSPVIEAFRHEVKIKEYAVSIDTMGQDKEIPEELLTFIEDKLEFFRRQWESKESKMLLDDILQFIEDQPSLQNQDNYFKDQQRGIISSNENQIRQQFPNREKEPEFELTVLKANKLIKILQQAPYINSMHVYLSYKVPKYKEIIQIIAMLLGYNKADINLSRSNTLNARKCLTKDWIEKMLNDLQRYELKREKSETVNPQYKINKLLQRLEKIDAEAVGKYNSWLFALLTIAKTLCWGRIQCRDAKVQAHEAKTKAMNERQAQIAKYEEELEKALEGAKAEVTEEMPPFNEEEWMKTYAAENPKPQKLFVEELKQFLDIQ